MQASSTNILSKRRSLRRGSQVGSSLRVPQVASPGGLSASTANDVASDGSQQRDKSSEPADRKLRTRTPFAQRSLYKTRTLPAGYTRQRANGSESASDTDRGSKPERPTRANHPSPEIVLFQSPLTQASIRFWLLRLDLTLWFASAPPGTSGTLLEIARRA